MSNLVTLYFRGINELVVPFVFEYDDLIKQNKSTIGLRILYPVKFIYTAYSSFKKATESNAYLERRIKMILSDLWEDDPFYKDFEAIMLKEVQALLVSYCKWYKIWYGSKDTKFVPLLNKDRILLPEVKRHFIKFSGISNPYLSFINYMALFISRTIFSNRRDARLFLDRLGYYLADKDEPLLNSFPFLIQDDSGRYGIYV
jgi:hypothetical protein